MALPLPDLDTGRFPELADEARAAIPRTAPAWTDHNLADPGITLTELVAAEVDRLMYRVNRITDRDRRTLLRLLGFAPRPPAPAAGVVAFSLAGAAPAPRVLPAGLSLVARDLAGGAVPLVLREPVRVGTAALAAVLAGDGDAPRDILRELGSPGGVAGLGDDPNAERSSALYLGFDPAPETGETLQLVLAIDDAGLDPFARPDPAPARTGDPVLAWECFDGAQWLPVAADDPTRGLARSGTLRLTIDRPVPVVPLAPHPVPLAWLRCRLAGGRPDRAPRLTGVAVHAAAVEQAAAAITRLRLVPGLVVAPGRDPVAGTSVPLALTVDQDGGVDGLAAGPPLTTTAVKILQRTAAALLATVVPVGRGARRPHQRFRLPGAPMVAAGVAAWVVQRTPAGLDAESLRLIAALDAAGPHDTVAVLDADTGVLTTGDGRHGRMLGPDEFVLARYETTRGASGNLHAASACRIAADPDGPNDALLGEPGGAVGAAVTVAIPWPVTGGRDAENAGRAAARAAQRLSAHERLLELLPADGPPTLDGIDPGTVRGCEPPERALTGPDLERVVLATAGRRIMRCRAFPELDPELPGLRAAGTATVVVVPGLPRAAPEPTPALLAAVRAEVERRRIVGSRVVVTGPTYVTVGVRAELVLTAAADRPGVLGAARQALDAFLHPLAGGPRGQGWPFGRDVYRAEILAVLDDVLGVANVAALDLLDTAGRATCGNLSVPATSLVAPGPHDLREAPR